MVPVSVWLVHGTDIPRLFRRKRKERGWIREGSKLRTLVAERLGCRIDWRPFSWSGGNSHQARLDAADDLTAKLVESLCANSRTHTFIIAHSHGGTIATYAVKRLPEGLRSKVSGVVCLGTPFLSCEPRLQRISDMAGILLLALLFCAFAYSLFVT